MPPYPTQSERNEYEIASPQGYRKLSSYSSSQAVVVGLVCFGMHHRSGIRMSLVIMPTCAIAPCHDLMEVWLLFCSLSYQQFEVLPEGSSPLTHGHRSRMSPGSEPL